MTNNKSINPMFLSALDILTGALGVFIILNFLQTRTTGVAPHPITQPLAQSAVEDKKPNKPSPSPKPTRRPTADEQRPIAPPPTKNSASTPQKPSPAPENIAKTEDNSNPTDPMPPTPPQDPVAVDLMKQTKGDVTLLLQQEGLAKQSVEFMLKQGNQVWKPGRAGKYQTDDFQYEKSLNYFYQARIKPGRYEVWVRVKKRTNASGQQPFTLFGKIIQPGYRSITHHFGTYTTAGSEWVLAGTFVVSNNSVSYQSALPLAPTAKPSEEAAPASPSPTPASYPTPSTRPEPKRSGKWGR